ncbi:MAG TPA: hypothetical protein PK400_00105 [Phycisphaerales bacterium]|nr:hypothetical protein [Phycisphaerales bacterium]HRQ75182.1 hypothetical protein [Phycisphaerales bacterium]
MPWLSRDIIQAACTLIIAAEITTLQSNSAADLGMLLNAYQQAVQESAIMDPHEWIETLEQAMDQSDPASPHFVGGAIVLADLYKQSGQPALAAAMHGIVAERSPYPDTQLSHAYQRAITAGQSDLPLEQTLSYFTEFRALLHEYKQQNIAVSQIHDVRDARLGVDQSNAIVQYARRFAQQINSAGAGSEANLVLAAYLSQAMTLLESDIQGHINDPFAGAPRMAANIMREVALLYASIGLHDAAASANERTAAILEHIRSVNDLPDAIQQNVATQLFAVQMEMLPRSEFVKLVSNVLDDTPPGHQVLTFLFDIGHSWSNKMANDLKFADLIHANQILRLVVDYEQHWFGIDSEFKSHVNYQWSLMVMARNFLAMGDARTAEALLAELEGINLAGDYLPMEYQALREAAARRLDEYRTMHERPQDDSATITFRHTSPSNIPLTLSMPIDDSRAIQIEPEPDIRGRWFRPALIGVAGAIFSLILIMLLRRQQP